MPLPFTFKDHKTHKTAVLIYGDSVRGFADLCILQLSGINRAVLNTCVTF